MNVAQVAGRRGAAQANGLDVARDDARRHAVELGQEAVHQVEQLLRGAAARREDALHKRLAAQAAVQRHGARRHKHGHAVRVVRHGAVGQQKTARVHHRDAAVGAVAHAVGARRQQQAGGAQPHDKLLATHRVRARVAQHAGGGARRARRRAARKGGAVKAIVLVVAQVLNAERVRARLDAVAGGAHAAQLVGGHVHALANARRRAAGAAVPQCGKQRAAPHRRRRRAAGAARQHQQVRVVAVKLQRSVVVVARCHAKHWAATPVRGQHQACAAVVAGQQLAHAHVARGARAAARQQHAHVAAQAFAPAARRNDHDLALELAARVLVQQRVAVLGVVVAEHERQHGLGHFHVEHALVLAALQPERVQRAQQRGQSLAARHRGVRQRVAPARRQRVQHKVARGARPLARQHRRRVALVGRVYARKGRCEAALGPRRRRRRRRRRWRGGGGLRQAKAHWHACACTHAQTL